MMKATLLLTVFCYVAVIAAPVDHSQSTSTESTWFDFIPNIIRNLFRFIGSWFVPKTSPVSNTTQEKSTESHTVQKTSPPESEIKQKTKLLNDMRHQLLDELAVQYPKEVSSATRTPAELILLHERAVAAINDLCDQIYGIMEYFSLDGMEKLSSNLNYEKHVESIIKSN